MSSDQENVVDVGAQGQNPLEHFGKLFKGFCPPPLANDDEDTLSVNEDSEEERSIVEEPLVAKSRGMGITQELAETDKNAQKHSFLKTFLTILPLVVLVTLAVTHLLPEANAPWK